MNSDTGAAGAGVVESTARIRPGERRHVGTVNWAIAAISGRVAGTEPPKLFLTLGRNRALFRGWLRFAGRLMPGGRLPRRESELVILRVARSCGCDYEFEHHVRLGARVGVTGIDVGALSGPLERSDWSPREAVILATTDALLAREDLDDDEWNEISKFLDERELIELLFLVGHYRMLATAINTLGIQPDARLR